MRIGIIAAMDEEIEFILQHLIKQKRETIAECLFINGQLHSREVILLKSGIGKVNAAMATTILHERYKPDVIINTGSAGGYSSNLNVGDIVISNEVVHHDVDATGFGYTYGQVPKMPETFVASKSLIEKTSTVIRQMGIQYDIGMIATGDSFMDDSKRVSFVRKQFPNVIAVEMEAAAIAQVCYQYGTPFVIIRALSDIAGKEATVSFDSFLKQAAKNASDIVRQMVKDI